MIASIQILQSMGYMVTLEGDQIVLEYGGGTPPDAAIVGPLVDDMRQHKSAVIALLNTNSHFEWEVIENDADATYQQIPGEFFTETGRPERRSEMRIEDCEVGHVVSMRDQAVGYLVGDVVKINKETVRVQFRSSRYPKPVAIDPRRLWSMENQLQLID